MSAENLGIQKQKGNLIMSSLCECPSCGAKSSDTDERCQKCGTPLKTVDANVFCCSQPKAGDKWERNLDRQMVLICSVYESYRMVVWQYMDRSDTSFFPSRLADFVRTFNPVEIAGETYPLPKSRWIDRQTDDVVEVSSVDKTKFMVCSIRNDVKYFDRLHSFLTRFRPVDDPYPVAGEKWADKTLKGIEVTVTRVDRNTGKVYCSGFPLGNLEMLLEDFLKQFSFVSPEPSLDDLLKSQFTECPQCSAKAGTSTLCQSCLQNRLLIFLLQCKVKNFTMCATEGKTLEEEAESFIRGAEKQAAEDAELFRKNPGLGARLMAQRHKLCERLFAAREKIEQDQHKISAKEACKLLDEDSSAPEALPERSSIWVPKISSLGLGGQIVIRDAGRDNTGQVRVSFDYVTGVFAGRLTLQHFLAEFKPNNGTKKTGTN